MKGRTQRPGAGLADRDSTVRFQAIAGLSEVGNADRPACSCERRCVKEPDAREPGTCSAETLGTTGATRWRVPILAAIAGRRRPHRVRSAPRRSRRCRDPAIAGRSAPALALIYDPNAPAAAWWPPRCRAWPRGASAAQRAGVVPGSHRPPVRAAALLSLNVRKPLPADVQQAVLDRLDDHAPEVREAAMPGRRSPSACPRPVRASHGTCAADPSSPNAPRRSRPSAGCPIRGPFRFISLRFGSRPPAAAIGGVGPAGDSRSACPTARRGARDRPTFSDAAALTLERVLARFEPIREWRVIGPFPRTTPQVFLGERSIDFGSPARRLLRADRSRGRPVRPSRRPAALTSNDFKRRGQRRGRFGYDSSRLARSLRLRLCRGRLRPRGPGLMLARAPAER